MREDQRPGGPDPERDAPDEAGVDESVAGSFPASDPPGHTPATAHGPPPARTAGPEALDPEALDHLPDEVHEHPVSDPASRSKEL